MVYNKSGEPLREEFHHLNKSPLLFRSLENPRIEAFCLTLSFVKSQITPITRIPCSHKSWKRADRLCIFVSFFLFSTNVSSDFANVIQLLLDAWEVCVRLLRRQKTGRIYHINIYNYSHINIIICTLKTSIILCLSV